MKIKVSCTQKEKDIGFNTRTWCHVIFEIFGNRVCTGDCKNCIDKNIEWEIVKNDPNRG